jgi:uncharacterized protein (TIGR00251 family)
MCKKSAKSPAKRLDVSKTTASQLPPHIKARSESSCTVAVHVKPGAKDNRVSLTEAAVHLAVDAPPKDGEPNDAVCTFLAELLNCKKRQVSLVTGHKSRNKVVALEDLSAETVLALLEKSAA